MTFKEKLELVNNIYFKRETNIKNISYETIVTIEKKLNIRIPESLKIFYLMFGEKEDFLRCMYRIIPLEELEIKNNILIIAIENQGTCSYGLNIKTNEVIYFTTSDYGEKIKLDIEDFLLYLLAIQGTGFFDCVVQMDTSEAEVLDKNFSKLSKVSGQYCVYYYSDEVIGFISGDDIFLSAKSDDIMNEIEEKYDLEFNYC